MLSHSTFSGWAHLGGPRHTGAFINHVWGRRERGQRGTRGPPCESHMGQQATVKHAVFEALPSFKR